MPAMTNSIWFTDSLIRIHVDPQEGANAHALLEILAPHGHQAPPHTHDEDDEGLFVLEGEVTISFADRELVLRPGQGANIPAGTPHALRVTSAGPVRALIVATPGRFADFVRMVGRPAEREALPVVDGPPDFELLSRAAQATGMTLLASLQSPAADAVAGV
jgi:mannose-6-phosphate isomerase-like protein (cupin superfamily)